MSDLRVEREGLEACIASVNTAIEELEATASKLDTLMTSELNNSWEGQSYDNCITTYLDQYQKTLTETVPQSVESLRAYIDKCMTELFSTDDSLAGK